MAMAGKKINRRTILRKDRPADKKITPEVKLSSPKTDHLSDGKTEEAGRPKKVCSFCQSKTNPLYTDMVVLRKFVTDRAKIVARAKSNLCSKHQRFATRQIKYARHLALLPFTPKV